MRGILLLPLLAACIHVRAEEAQKPADYRELDFGICERVRPAPVQLGAESYYIYHCAGGQVILDPAPVLEDRG